MLLLEKLMQNFGKAFTHSMKFNSIEIKKKKYAMNDTDPQNIYEEILKKEAATTTTTKLAGRFFQ